jgi:plasmid replication initiation protein
MKKGMYVTVGNNLVKAEYTLGLVEHRLICSLISGIDNNIKKNKKGAVLRDKLEIIDVKKHYSLEVATYAAHYNIDIRSAKEELEQAVLSLYRKEVTYVKDNGKKVTTRWISSIGEGEEGEVQVAWALDIIPLISQLRGNFTSYKLQHIQSLPSSYGIRWYSVLIMELARSRKRGVEIYLPVETIRDMFSLGDKYSLFSDFYKRVVEDPVQAINRDKNCNIDIGLKGVKGKKLCRKKGRVVAEVGFRIGWREEKPSLAGSTKLGLLERIDR